MPDLLLPTPPFTFESATTKVRAAEDAWNSCNPHRVSLCYTLDSTWRDKTDFLQGRSEIVAFLLRKWQREFEYRLIKELWAFWDNRIAVRFACEWHDDIGQWFRSYGNENWEFDNAGYLTKRYACINDLRIPQSERTFHWSRDGSRPVHHPGLSELGL